MKTAKTFSLEVEDVMKFEKMDKGERNQKPQPGFPALAENRWCDRGNMNQEDLLKYILDNPGITQAEVRKHYNENDISEKLTKLRLKKQITREPYKGTWGLYPG